jgi:hypothetical protein
MQQQTLNSDTKDLAPDDDRLPATAAPGADGLPNDGGDNHAEESWDSVNAKLSKGDSGADPEDDGLNELARLQRELAEERKLRETEEKRRKDSQRAFKERSEELKRLKTEMEAKQAEQAKQPESKASDTSDSDAPLSEERISELAEQYGLTEEEREFFEINPEGMTSIEKILKARLDAGLSERERLKEQQEQEARARAVEEEMEREANEKWMAGVKSYHQDASEIIETKEFNTWVAANDALRQTILNDREKYDPTGLAELLDHYKAHQSEVNRIRAKRQYGRQASVTPQPKGGSSTPTGDEESWEAINARLKKQKSRR